MHTFDLNCFSLIRSQALLASSFIPLFCGLMPPRFHGIRYMDGGFSDNLPTLDENTITVSPFCGESDICPRDGSSQLFHVRLLLISCLKSWCSIIGFYSCFSNYCVSGQLCQHEHRAFPAKYVQVRENSVPTQSRSEFYFHWNTEYSFIFVYQLIANLSFLFADFIEYVQTRLRRCPEILESEQLDQLHAMFGGANDSRGFGIARGRQQHGVRLGMLGVQNAPTGL